MRKDKKRDLCIWTSARVADHWVKRGRHVLIENPLSSQPWKQIMHTWCTDRCWKKLSWVRCDQCVLNLRDSEGRLVQKTTRFVTTAICVASALSLRCNGGHDHAPVQGRTVGESGRLGAWTAELAHRVILGTLQQLSMEQDEKLVEAFPAGDEDAMDEEDPDEHHDEENDPEHADVEPEEDEPPAVTDMRPERRMIRSAGVIFDDRQPRTFVNGDRCCPH